MIQNGKQVSIEYTLSLADGTVADSNVGGPPLTYEHGAGEILPALEQALAGMQVDQTTDVTLPPEQGYGPVDPEAFESVEVGMIPEGAREVGMELVGKDERGQEHQVRVHEVHDDHVILDLNHPLAGQTLRFHVKIIGIE